MSKNIKPSDLETLRQNYIELEPLAQRFSIEVKKIKLNFNLVS